MVALRMNEEVSGQLHTNTISIQDAQVARIWELEKQVDDMGLIIHELRKKQDTMASSLEEAHHQSVMCQAILTHYIESHWVPIGHLLEQIGGHLCCGLFPTTAPLHCDLSDADSIIVGENGPSMPSSLPSLESISSSSIDSVYYTPSFLQSTSTLPPISLSQEFIVVQGGSPSSSVLPSTIPGDLGLFGDFEEGSFFEGGFDQVSLLGDEGWSSGGSRGNALGSFGEGY